MTPKRVGFFLLRRNDRKTTHDGCYATRSIFFSRMFCILALFSDACILGKVGVLAASAYVCVPSADVALATKYAMDILLLH
jgi:hypothetical protein